MIFFSHYRAINHIESAKVGANELKELGTKLKCIERDCDGLRGRVSFLQADIDSEVQRRSVPVSSLISQDFLNKVKEMNNNLGEIVNKNRQLTETVELLTRERHSLQMRIMDLKKICIERNQTTDQIWDRCIRAENFRRALIHQKNYLMVLLNSYRKTEEKIAVIIGNPTKSSQRKKASFKCVALAIVASIRVKTILRRSKVADTKTPEDQ